MKAFTSGFALIGVDLKVINPDSEGNGELIMKGRNTFMGYLNNQKATNETIDKDGYVHSGDLA